LLWDKNEPPYVGYYNSQRMTATIVISGREWLLPAAGFLFVAVLLLVWTYLRAHADRKLRTTCAFLKLLGLAALLACLLDPLWSSQKAKPGANFFAIVADNSQGLGIKDRGEILTRGQSLTNLLAPEPDNWQDKLENNFQVRRYIFDSRLQSAKDFSELTFAGQASAIGAAYCCLRMATPPIYPRANSTPLGYRQFIR
jgi:hypothetical protein